MASPSNRHRQHIRIPGRFHTTTGISIPPAGAESGPAWRSLLEARWRHRLSTLTELSLAYHDAAERTGSGYHPAARAGPVAPRARQLLRRLLREATAARRALSDTEEALAGLAWTGQSSKENHITRDRDGLGSGTGG